MQRSDVIKKKYNKLTKKQRHIYMYCLCEFLFISYLIHVCANTLLIYALFLSYAITSTMTSYSFERSDTLYFMDDEFFL